MKIETKGRGAGAAGRYAAFLILAGMIWSPWPVNAVAAEVVITVKGTVAPDSFDDDGIFKVGRDLKGQPFTLTITFDASKAEERNNEGCVSSSVKGSTASGNLARAVLKIGRGSYVFGTKPESRWRVAPREQGVAEMMVDLYRTFSAPLSEKMIFGWHRMLMSGSTDIKDVGRYRTSDEPMQVVSGAAGAPKIHFEAPPSARIPGEMAGFIEWFMRTAPGGTEPLPALTRAGAAHLYFETIHPFEDGNGRIGRAIAEKSLAQSLGQPTLIVLAATILARRASYYHALEAGSPLFGGAAIPRWWRRPAGHSEAPGRG
jgi:hypothetical protein